jgi:hypothetical protein
MPLMRYLLFGQRQEWASLKCPSNAGLASLKCPFQLDATSIMLISVVVVVVIIISATCNEQIILWVFVLVSSSHLLPQVI